MSTPLDYLNEHQETFKEELFKLLRIPSISADPAHKEDVHSAAKYVAGQLERIGLNNVSIEETDGHPIVLAEHLEAGPDKPTVLIYGHYDVQPPDPLDEWKTPPFEPTVRDGKIYARGASDDKGQSFAHIKAIESFLKTGTELPVNVKFIIEGEEEIGSPSLVPFLAANKERLACDMVLVSDTAMFAKDTPSITYGLRGLMYLEVTVTGPNRDLHSGVYGGGVQNPVNALCEMIAKLKDENGVVQIPGFYDNVRPLTEKEREAYAQLPFDQEAYNKELDIDEAFGEKGYSTLERVSGRPSLDVNGIWGGYQGEGAKTVLPGKAGAKISTRLVPDQEPKEIFHLIDAYMQEIKPPGVRIDVREHHGGHPVLVDLDFYGLKAAAAAFEDVYGKQALFSREGGSIPIVADFAKTLNATTILMGLGLNSDSIHSPNEHFHLKDFERGMKTSARFFELLGDYVE
ncbi:dipeptidase [Natronogracilivirga saccharolytica]|uniref:Dipeptidase n=1 Tax=Natronogracilivirga saccharolytica TaxID=2812953 RepID=A0A8J7S7U4_9BACT|nr:dipeptidase [Natronogracilivirga saccharolytica]MBP3193573.1 dipeptidase [Natronogracilivirga saccharolytica]